MLNPESFFNILKKENINFFSGVPDSFLVNICNYISDNTTEDNHIIAANEGNALSIGIGYHLATNNLPLIYMQNSGLGNIVNPLLSLADQDVYSIPMLLMIGWRGESNIKDEPQHRKQGRVTEELLESLEIPFSILSSETSEKEVSQIVHKAVSFSRINNTPYALLVKKGTYAKYALKTHFQYDFALYREEAIRLVVNSLSDLDIVVSTTGFTSRELFECREVLGQDHKRDFLSIGGMGHSNQIALGIALQKPNRLVYCLDGDGSILMHMGSLAVSANSNCNNLKHIVFNNGCHDSVGGQPTVALKIKLKSIAVAMGYDKVIQASSESEIQGALKELQKFNGKVFLEILVKKGSRSDLGRPTITPHESKKAFMEFIK